MRSQTQTRVRVLNFPGCEPLLHSPCPVAQVQKRMEGCFTGILSQLTRAQPLVSFVKPFFFLLHAVDFLVLSIRYIQRERERERVAFSLRRRFFLRLGDDSSTA